MIRSFHYAALRGQASTILRPEDLPVFKEWARSWYLWVSATFLKSYLQFTADIPILPRSREDIRVILDAYLLDKAMYEVNYELNNRPDWVGLPLQGILQMLGVEEEEAIKKAEKEAEVEPVKIIAEAKQKSEQIAKEVEQTASEIMEKAKKEAKQEAGKILAESKKEAKQVVEEARQKAKKED